jgi:hypothetical protein
MDTPIEQNISYFSDNDNEGDGERYNHIISTARFTHGLIETNNLKGI